MSERNQASQNQTSPNVVIGGGIIGLSIAYELAKRGQQVVVLERGQFGQQASWAGAGIITPANAETAIHPLEHLEALSHELHEVWSQELLGHSGIDNGFRKCGGLYLARTSGEVAALTGVMSEWGERKIEFESLDEQATRQRFGYLSAKAPILKSAWVPGESQFDNRKHLDALKASCRQLGVQLYDNVGDVEIETVGNRICLVQGESKFESGNFFIAAGPWSEQIVEPAGIALPMQPVRGQIALYHIPERLQQTKTWPIINEGSRYLVPRSDGHIIAGATIEEVGFDCQTTASEIADLRGWAERTSELLNENTFVESWAGLRPGTYDGFPYLGRLGDFENGFVATGHFKSGLHLSTGTAVVIADLAEGKTPTVDLRPFSPRRAAHHEAT